MHTHTDLRTYIHTPTHITGRFLTREVNSVECPSTQSSEVSFGWFTQRLLISRSFKWFQIWKKFKKCLSVSSISWWKKELNLIMPALPLFFKEDHIKGNSLRGLFHKDGFSFLKSISGDGYIFSDWGNLCSSIVPTISRNTMKSSKHTAPLRNSLQCTGGSMGKLWFTHNEMHRLDSNRFSIFNCKWWYYQCISILLKDFATRFISVTKNEVIMKEPLTVL